MGPANLTVDHDEQKRGGSTGDDAGRVGAPRLYKGRGQHLEEAHNYCYDRVARARTSSVRASEVASSEQTTIHCVGSPISLAIELNEPSDRTTSGDIET